MRRPAQACAAPLKRSKLPEATAKLPVNPPPRAPLAAACGGLRRPAQPSETVKARPRAAAARLSPAASGGLRRPPASPHRAPFLAFFLLPSPSSLTPLLGKAGAPRPARCLLVHGLRAGGREDRGGPIGGHRGGFHLLHQFFQKFLVLNNLFLIERLSCSLGRKICIIYLNTSIFAQESLRIPGKPGIKNDFLPSSTFAGCIY